MGPRHNVDYSDEEGKPIIRRSSRQLAKGKRRVYTNGFQRCDRDSSPSILELFQKATNRRPRKFTERRQERLVEFMRNFNKHEQRYGTFGSSQWIDALIRFLGEKRRSALLRLDVTYWIQTSSFFTKYLKRVPFSSRPAKVAKRRSPQSFCDTSSPSGSSPSPVSDDDSSSEAESVDDVESVKVGPSNYPLTHGRLTSTEARKPLSAIQSQATVTSPVPVSAAFANMEIGQPSADSTSNGAAEIHAPAPQPVPVQSVNNVVVPQEVSSAHSFLHLPQGPQIPSVSATCPQVNFSSSVEGPLQTFPPATMSFEVPLGGAALPDMGQEQQILIQQGGTPGWTFILTPDGQIVADPSVISVTPHGVIQSIPSTCGGTSRVLTEATLTSSTGETSKGFYLNLNTDALGELTQTCSQPGTTADAVVSQMLTPGASPQDLLTYYSDAIVQMIGELRKNGSTIVNTEGSYLAASLLSLCLRNNL